MTSEQNEIIKRLREKIRLIITLYEKTKEEKRLLEEENNDLIRKIKEKEKDYLQIEQKYNTLKLAKVISGNNNEDSHEAKIKVNKIVREIDKCIALLNR